MQRQDPTQSPFIPFSPNPSLQQGTPTATAPLKHSLTVSQTSNLRYASSRKSIYDRHLNRSQRSELSKASFAFLFGEMVQYAQKRVSGIQDLEKKLATLNPSCGVDINSTSTASIPPILTSLDLTSTATQSANVSSSSSSGATVAPQNAKPES